VFINALTCLHAVKGLLLIFHRKSC